MGSILNGWTIWTKKGGKANLIWESYGYYMLKEMIIFLSQVLILGVLPLLRHDLTSTLLQIFSDRPQEQTIYKHKYSPATEAVASTALFFCIPFTTKLQMTPQQARLISLLWAKLLRTFRTSEKSPTFLRASTAMSGKQRKGDISLWHGFSYFLKRRLRKSGLRESPQILH